MRSSAYAALLGLLVAMAALSLHSAAAGAQAGAPTISITASISVEAASQAPLVIRVGPPEALPKGCFIRVRGLPPMAALSEGHSIAPGSWAVPIAALPNLKITLPVAASGRSEISVTLVSIDGAVLGEAKSVLTVAAAPPASEQVQTKALAPPLSILRAGAPQQAAPEPSPPNRPAVALPSEKASKLPAAQREHLLRLLKKGDEQLAEGGIAQARLLYERIAEAGLPEGAMALAATYDAAELERLGVRGLQPDPAAAKRWYERAEQLGAADAAQRLRRLGAR